MGQNEGVLMLWIYNNVFIKENEVIDMTPQNTRSTAAVHMTFHSYGSSVVQNGNQHFHGLYDSDLFFFRKVFVFQKMSCSVAQAGMNLLCSTGCPQSCDHHQASDTLELALQMAYNIYIICHHAQLQVGSQVSLEGHLLKVWQSIY